MASSRWIPKRVTKVALEKAADWLKKHPNQKATMRLGNKSRALLQEE
jgi:hypothetical protein